MSEVVYYSDRTSRITDNRVQVEDHIYLIPDIRAARRRFKLAEDVPKWERSILICGAFSTIAIMLLIVSIKIGADNQYNLLIMSLAFLQALVVAVTVILLRKMLYTVELEGAFGKVTILVSKDGRRPRRIVTAIQTAIDNKVS